VEKLNFYKLRAKVICEDLSSVLGVMAIWDGTAESEYGLSYPDPRLPALGSRIMLPPHLAEDAAADLGGMLAGADAYEAHRIALGVPRGGLDFIYGDTFSHEADMDQLNGVDFGKGCYIGQEVVSRVEHRASARSRVVPIVYDEFAPSSGLPVMAGDRQIGTLGSTAKGHGLALMRLDRIGDALAAGATIEAGGIAIRAVKPAWAKFDWPGEAKAPA
jgi:folate-binding protein YgfZ